MAADAVATEVEVSVEDIADAADLTIARGPGDAELGSDDATGCTRCLTTGECLISGKCSCGPAESCVVASSQDCLSYGCGYCGRCGYVPAGPAKPAFCAPTEAVHCLNSVFCKKFGLCGFYAAGKYNAAPEFSPTYDVSALGRWNYMRVNTGISHVSVCDLGPHLCRPTKVEECHPALWPKSAGKKIAIKHNACCSADPSLPDDVCWP